MVGIYFYKVEIVFKCMPTLLYSLCNFLWYKLILLTMLLTLSGLTFTML